eukprot:PhF_6_TR31189/c0_g1_i1/m.45737/K00077/panE, apbA; 2-dehydropantoate 2-reductase
MRWYVVGRGNIGCYFNAALYQFYHTPSPFLVTPPGTVCSSHKVLWHPLQVSSPVLEFDAPVCSIDDIPSSYDGTLHIIVALRAPQAVEFLRTVKQFQNVNHSGCNIHLMGNGVLGVIEEALEASSDDVAPSFHSNLFVGAVSHGVTTIKRTATLTEVQHKGIGSVQLGRWCGDAKHVNETVLSFQEVMTHVEYVGDTAAARRMLLRKAIVNSCINPLTVIENDRNGFMLNNADCLKVISQIVDECVEIAKLRYGHENVDIHTHDMYQHVLDVATRTAMNTSSSLQEVIRGVKRNDSELHYFNGYFVKIARQLNIQVPNTASVYERALLRYNT